MSILEAAILLWGVAFLGVILWIYCVWRSYDPDEHEELMGESRGRGDGEG